MNQKTAILPILAVLSVVALVGGFAIQAAEAQMTPRTGIRIGPIGVDARGVQIATEEVTISMGTSGITIDSPLFPFPER